VAWDSYHPKHQGIKVDGQIADFGNMSIAGLVVYAFHLPATDQVPDMPVQLFVDRFNMKSIRTARNSPFTR